MTATYKTVEVCRACGSDMFTPLLSLGDQYIIDFLKNRTDETRGRAPLDLLLCNSCLLVQLKHSVEPDDMFRQYWYRSGTNPSMVASLEDIVCQAAKKTKLNVGDGVLDIGANDGTLLSFYPHSIRRTAVDPSGQKFVLPCLNGNICNEYIPDFFNVDQHKDRQYSVITAIAMFYDLENPGQFLKDLASILHPEGLIVIQQNWLLSMLTNIAVDNISHEHVTYFSLYSMMPLIKAAGLRVSDVAVNDVNGGSFRVYLRHKDYKSPITVSGGAVKDTDQEELVGPERVRTLLEKEESLKSLGVFARFVSRWEEIKQILSTVLIKYHNSGIPVCAYGASTRGNTILQALDLPEGVLLGCAEKAPEKFGLTMVGSWLPIFSEEDAKHKCNTFFVLPYHFYKSILQREAEFLSTGGRFIFPLPSPVMTFQVGGTMRNLYLTKNG